MTYDQVSQLIKSFAPQITIRGSSFLLPLDKDEAHRFITQAEKAGIRVLGMTLWFHSKKYDRPVEDPRYDFGVDHDVFVSEDSVANCARSVHEYLDNLDDATLTEHAYMSFEFDTFAGWERQILAEIKRSRDM
jgi:hypothetical protein